MEYLLGIFTGVMIVLIILSIVALVGVAILGCARASGKSGKLHMTHDMYFCYEDSKLWQELKKTER